MYSTEEKKPYLEQNDTASSDFYKAPTLSLFKSQEPAETSSIERLQDNLAKVRETLATNQELLKRLESNEELKKYVEETEQELEVVRARAMNEQNNLKLSFEKNFSSLERELAAYKKSWRQIKENAEAEMEEQISGFKAGIKKDQAALNKALSSTASDFKSKSANLVLELKQTKKLRGQSTNFLMGMIEQARVKFDNFTEGERKKRNEYDSIVLGLLDRTVDQGEKLLRRIG